MVEGARLERVYTYLSISSAKEPVPAPTSRMEPSLIFSLIKLEIIKPKNWDTSGEVRKSPSLDDLTISVLKKPDSE